MNKVKKFRLIISLIICCIFLILLAEGVLGQEAFYCAEKTINNEWCQMVPLNEVNTNYRYDRTSCESTSYCKIGTCISVGSGTCQSAPMTLCNPDEGGYFDPREINEILDCREGCCILSIGAKIVRKVQCDALSRHLNIVSTFRHDVTTEEECSVLVASSRLGACIIETDIGRTCSHKTGGECLQTSDGVTFHEGYLCSNPQLGTGCLISNRTRCVEGKNEVYFVDSCGNTANVYDWSKRTSTLYWGYFPGYGGVELSKGDGQGNSGNPNHGYCEYTKGSTCARYDMIKDGINAKPSLGNYVCRDLSCPASVLTGGEKREHGESWCLKPLNRFEEAKVGQISHLLYCMNGEVQYEVCDHYRNSICYEDDSGNKSYASCKKNNWQECFGHENERDCLRIDRDCSVLPMERYTELYGYYQIHPNPSAPTEWNSFILTEDVDKSGVIVKKDTEVICVPRYPPGIKFWEAEPLVPQKVLDGLKKVDISTNVDSVCEITNDACKVTYYRKSSGWLPWGTAKKCESNCICVGLSYGDQTHVSETLDNDWVRHKNKICITTSDCGGSSETQSNTNFLDVNGLFDLVELASSSGAGKWGRVQTKKGWWRRRAYGTVDFTCKLWHPPIGGEDCERCNNQLFPCTGYQCKSLGAACELIQENTDNPICIWKNKNDVSPPTIQPREESLWDQDYVYDPITPVPGGGGVEIKYTKSNDGCLPAFQPFSFGIALDKLGYCRYEYESTKGFEDMEFDFGKRATYALNHTQILSLPGVKHMQMEYEEMEGIAYDEGLGEEFEELVKHTLHLDGKYKIYVRCMSVNGVPNRDEFLFQFCMEEEDDITPPIIRGFNWQDGAALPFFYEGESMEVDVKVYVNKPAECKWHWEDKSYEEMENILNCPFEEEVYNNHLVYSCKGKLTGIGNDKLNDFYFRCNSTFGAINTESKKLTLVGTKPLSITSISPNQTTIKGGTSPVTVTLEVETYAGYEKGVSVCQYSPSGDPGTYEEFTNTNSHQHSTNLYLKEKEEGHKYYIRCYDEAGNSDMKIIQFYVETDTSPPKVVRVYREGGNLRIITNEEASCVYNLVASIGCMYDFEDGTSMTSSSNDKIHSTTWILGRTFYIKCRDQFGNQPYGTDLSGCSIVIRPFEV